MDPSSVIQIIIIIILLMLSAFFSSAETAFTTINRIHIRSLAEDGNKRAKKVAELLENSGKLLSAVLIGNTIVNISASAIVTAFVINSFGSEATGIVTGIATGILTILVLIFGEIAPKTAATIHAEKLALSYAKPISFVMFVLTPVIIIINKLSKYALKFFGIDSSKKKKLMTEDELRTIVTVGHEDGIIESEERRIINNLFDFGDSQAKDIMIPRIDMTLASVDSTYDEILEIFRSEKYTRIPIYEDTVDNVIGIINVKDLLLFDTRDAFNIRGILREPYFTYEYKNTAELLAELRKTSNNITIVIDEYGSTVGMITLEDLLEEIVGEIRDEYDDDEHDSIQKINDNEYRLDGYTKLDDLNDFLALDIESEDYDSIGGFIIEKLDRLPIVNDYIELPGIRLVVESASNNRIETVHLYLGPTSLGATPETL
ncbi:HlyC/CorC family transporter [[Clostridium] fimetarium]|uniref:Hemolysin, contains CBS domains n=1 Tax=[Clostridium] fimetarium TaxID=99656 RepID=A0A1I0QDA7_9FIRM|nr:hemolysin family protein [[Clostridium] fimetarium]SEW24578.1 Hemolysin, contains CBS domains [[Clostridium] fimetarium]